MSNFETITEVQSDVILNREFPTDSAFEAVFKSTFTKADRDVFKQIGIPNIKKYGFQDFIILLGIFGLGFIFSWTISAFRRDQKK